MKKMMTGLMALVVGVLATSCSATKEEILQLLSSSSISISSASASAVNISSLSVNYQIRYAGVSSVTLQSSDILVQTTGTAACAKTVSNVTSDHATVSFHGCIGNGSVNFKIAEGSAKNLVGTPLAASSYSASFTVDNSGVSSANFLALPGAYSAIPASIEVYFSETVDPSTISVNDFSIAGSCAGVSISNVDVSSSMATVHLTGESACAVGETVALTAHFSVVADALGNLGSGSSTGTYSVTNIGPTSGNFAPNYSAVSLNFNSLTIALPGFIDASTVGVEDFSLSGTCSAVSISSVSISNSDVTVQLSDVNQCINGQTIIIDTDLSGIDDVSGNHGSNIISKTYTLDTLSPSITFATPFQTVTAIPTSLDITFPVDTDMSSVTIGDFSLSGTCTNSGLANLTMLENVATVEINSHCHTSETVQLSVNLSDIMDLSGNVGSGVESVSFTLDFLGPAATLSVSSGSVSSIPSSVSTTFDSDTDMNTVTAADFSVSGSCGVSLSGITKVGAVVTLNLSGYGACTHGQTVIITQDFTTTSDILGNAGVESRSVTLTVDTVGPVGTFLLSNSTVNAFPTSVEISMSSDTDMDNINTSHFIISGTCGATLGGIVKTENIVRIDLGGTSSCNSGETLMVIAAQGSMQDLAGNIGSGASILTLTLDNVGPTVILSSASGNYNPLPSSINATFSADTDMNTVTAADFSVIGSCGASVGSISVSGQIVTVNLSGTNLCTQDQTVEISINPVTVTDLVGNSGLNSSFSVIHTFDQVGPTISIVQVGGMMAVLPSEITIIFEADTDMSTVTAADFSIGGTCSVSLDSISKSGNVVTLNLGGTGSCLAIQTMIVTTTLTGVLDQAGNAGVGSQARIYVMQ